MYKEKGEVMVRTLEDIRGTESGDHKFTLGSIVVKSPKNVVIFEY